MSAAKSHTPGPWVYGDWITRKQGAKDGAGWVEVWSEADPENCLPIIACKHHDKMANARLIAAAPELLELLQQWMTEYGDCAEGGEDDELMQFSRAAIAKATGVAA